MNSSLATPDDRRRRPNGRQKASQTKKPRTTRKPAAKAKADRLVRTRKARQTGTTIETWEGLKGKPGWFLLCTEHRKSRKFKSHTEAAPLAATPVEWCPGCQKEGA